jgi:hypothetical protein
MAENGWTHAAPAEGASYWTPRGDPRRLDHAFASPGLAVRKAEYVAAIDGYVLAGTREALSDHAALLLEVM